jgi:hypothetical protein
MCQRRNSSRSCQRAGPTTLMGLLLCLAFSYTGAQANVWRELRPADVCDAYWPMTDSQLSRAESLFGEMLQRPDPTGERFADDWAALGYELVKIPAAGPGWLGLREAGLPCSGNGVYLINGNDPAPLVVQAPHAYHDLFTGDIAAGLARDGVAIVAWNSAKRNTGTGFGQTKADFAKRRDSLFVALTRALIKSVPKGRLIQIHGFDNRRRSTSEGSGAAIILSSGARWTTRSVDIIARCLQPVIDGPVLIYPTEVTELGATKNFHGQTLRRYGHEGFVHVEINRPTRKRLKTEPALLSAFSACLGSGIER